MSENSAPEEASPGSAMFRTMANLESYKLSAKGYPVAEDDVEIGAKVLEEAHKKGEVVTRADVTTSVADHTVYPKQKIKNSHQE